jgi:hypothetical protein
VVRCSAVDRPDVFAAALVNVGALGVVTGVTLRCVPSFVLRADERPLPLASVLADLDEHVDGNDHFEFYWFPYTEGLSPSATTGRRSRTRRCPAFGVGSTTSSCPTGSSAAFAD